MPNVVAANWQYWWPSKLQSMKGIHRQMNNVETFNLKVKI